MSQVNHEQSNPFNKDSKGALKSVRINGVPLISGLLNSEGKYELGILNVSVIYLSCSLIKFECRSLKWARLRKQLNSDVKFIKVPFFS